MKRLTYLFAILAIASTSFFTSCTKDDTTDQNPTLNLSGGNGYVASDVTLTNGEYFVVGVNAFSNATSNSKLASFKVTRTSNNKTDPAYDTTFSTASYAVDIEFQALTTAGTERWEFTVTDKAGNTATKSFTITTTAAAGDINTYTAVLMGGQLNPTLGSFYSTATNSVLKWAAANAAPASVDFVYYYGTSNLATISAPADADVTSVTNFSGIANWNPRNATKFKKLSGVTWENINSAATIGAQATALSLTKANSLAIGDLVAFETAATSTNVSKKGVFKVVSLQGTSAGTDRTITIEVKIVK